MTGRSDLLKYLSLTGIMLILLAGCGKKDNPAGATHEDKMIGTWNLSRLMLVGEGEKSTAACG